MGAQPRSRPVAARLSLLVASIVLVAAVPAVAQDGPVEIHSALLLDRGVGDNPLAGDVLHDQADAQVDVARAAETDARRGELLGAVATQPQGRWLTGDVAVEQVAARVRTWVAEAAGAVPVLVVYALPGRDCGSYSAGGAADEAAYLSWVDQLAAGLRADDGEAVVVLEPDGLAQLDCLDAGARASRLRMLTGAVDRLGAQPQTHVYLDAGHSGWVPAAEMAGRLLAAGVDRARGFSLNVSNFQPTADLTDYAADLSVRTGGAHAVLDTGRNGTGPAPAGPLSWCNPEGRALGTPPTTATGSDVVDALLWIKPPGESDGTCGPGQLPAGQLDVPRALELARTAGY